MAYTLQETANTDNYVAKVSLDRVNDFLHKTELLDAYSAKADPQISHDHGQDLEGVIGFKDASFAWTAETNGSATPSQRLFKLKVQGELRFQRNRINLIVGPTLVNYSNMCFQCPDKKQWLWENIHLDGIVR